MRELPLLFLTLFFAGSSIAQEPLDTSPCYFDQHTNNQSIRQAEQKIAKAVQNNLAAQGVEASHDVRTVPVVVHVIHQGGVENISQAQVQSQIQIINEDFGKFPGSNGDGNGVDTKIRFCLAQLDPDGNCTDGIVRINSPLTNHLSYQRALLKELSLWDNKRYLNIYLVRNINGGVGGYASFPGGPADEDGIVVRHNLFGNIGTASGLGRTTTHELGHWLGVYHTFNNGCGTDLCTDGDFVCDTPPVSIPNSGCPSNNSCSNDSPDLNDQVENYMDYTSDVCQNMFSNGQAQRMIASLDTIRTQIWSASNLISTGCDSNYTPPITCPVTASFVTLTTDICVGNSVYFMDRSLNTPTLWQWTFPGGTPASSSDQNPTVTYASVGTYSVKLIVSDSNGSDSLEINSFITVSTPGVGDPVSFNENFDTGIYPPSKLTINNLDGGITWELDSAASVSGGYSIKINNLINTNYGTTDELVLPDFDLTTAHPDSAVKLTFQWAYAKSDPTFSDEMLVLLSTDCGVNFTQIFYKTQSALATGPTQTTPFVPDSSQWREADISLELYRDESFVQLKIVNVTDGGNNLYIDNIYMGDGLTPVVGLERPGNSLHNLLLYPNPTLGSTTVLEYQLDKMEEVRVDVYTLHGQLVQTYDEGTQGPGLHRLTLASDVWSVGVYLVKVATPAGINTLKFTKLN